MSSAARSSVLHGAENSAARRPSVTFASFSREGSR